MEQKNIIKESAEKSHKEMGGVAIHSQVMKIKEEFEKVKQPERRGVVHGVARARQRPRSPLGFGLAERSISVGITRNSNYRV